MLLNRISKTTLLVLFCLVTVALYTSLFLFYDRLQFPLIWDEKTFWSTTLLFSDRLVPSLELLKDYGELNTPLPFIVFGALEYITQNGLFAGRFLNFSLSALITFTIGAPLAGKRKQSVLAACGLLLFPYYLWLSSHFYTDILATFFVFAGVWLYLRNQHIFASLCFILAIASRQFMLVFPAAIAVYEGTSALLAAFHSGSLTAGWQTLLRTNIRWMPPAFAALTILGWFWLFNGLAPESGLEVRSVPEVQTQVWAIAVDSSLYFLSCIGLYFVIPEWMLFHRSLNWRSLLTPRNGAIALSLLILFAAFPPTVAHGLLIKLVKLVPTYFLKTLLLLGLAFLTCTRFLRFNLEFCFLLVNTVLMIKAFPWDKYALPLLVVLWYLKALDTAEPKYTQTQQTSLASEIQLAGSVQQT